MIITLNDSDIKLALANYVKSVVGRPIAECDINITAGRGANGYSADVDLTFVDEAKTSKIESGFIRDASIAGAPTPKLDTSTLNYVEAEEDVTAQGETSPTPKVDKKMFGTPEEILEPVAKKPNLADKISNPEDGKKTNLNLFAASED